MTKEAMRGWLCDGDPVFNVFNLGRCSAGRSRHSVRAVRLRIQEGVQRIARPINSVGCEPKASLSFQRKLSASLG
jgi:hypothetical protein